MYQMNLSAKEIVFMKISVRLFLELSKHDILHTIQRLITYTEMECKNLQNLNTKFYNCLHTTA